MISCPWGTATGHNGAVTIDVWMQHPTLRFLELDDETRDLFLTGNARRVFALGQ